MIKIYTMLAAFLLITISPKAQDTTKPFYFPHKTGNMWEYFYDDYSPMYVDTLQNFTIFDSTNSRGIIYMKQHAQFINPTRPSMAVLEDTTNYWVDTVNNYVWGKDKDQGDSSLIYKLNVNKGEQWVVFNYVQLGGSDYQIARVTNKWKDTLFSKPTTFMNIFYYIAQDSTDTTGMIELGYDEIADGFGLVSRGGGDSPGEIRLIGAVINGLLYGDTTVVSVKNKRNILPTSIHLFQNYPNPFNPSTTIAFEISKPTNVSMMVYDVLGNEVKSLISNKYYSAGNYQIMWDGISRNGNKAASGIYFYCLIIENKALTRSMILLK